VAAASGRFRGAAQYSADLPQIARIEAIAELSTEPSLGHPLAASSTAEGHGVLMLDQMYPANEDFSEGLGAQVSYDGSTVDFVSLAVDDSTAMIALQAGQTLPVALSTVPDKRRVQQPHSSPSIQHSIDFPPRPPPQKSPRSSGQRSTYSRYGETCTSTLVSHTQRYQR
jgi:hypothetical protein